MTLVILLLSIVLCEICATCIWMRVSGGNTKVAWRATIARILQKWSDSWIVDEPEDAYMPSRLDALDGVGNGRWEGARVPRRESNSDQLMHE